MSSYYSSSGTESFSDDSLTLSASDLEELNEEFQGLKLEPYQFEPQKLENTLNKEECATEEIASSNIIEEHDNNRAGNNTWCSCGFCSSEKRELDCLCCREISAIADEAFF